jgi:hypothetical protein
MMSIRAIDFRRFEGTYILKGQQVLGFLGSLNTRRLSDNLEDMTYNYPHYQQSVNLKSCR